MKLNVGCGMDLAPGYENLDNSLSILIQENSVLRALVGLVERISGKNLYTRFPPGVQRYDVTRGLRYGSETVETIYSSHFLEHLPRRQAERFLREAYGVLRTGGRLRLALPDLERKARKYLEEVELTRAEHQNPAQDLPADSFLRSAHLGAESRWSVFRPGSVYRAILAREGHLWMWDAPSLVILLRSIGFTRVSECGFRESVIPEIALLDVQSRKDESFYVEARK